MTIMIRMSDGRKFEEKNSSVLAVMNSYFNKDSVMAFGDHCLVVIRDSIVVAEIKEIK